MASHAFSIPKEPLLAEDETLSLIALAQSGDDSAKEKLVRNNLRLVYSMAMRFNNTGREMDDLFQVGAIGLLKAIERFDPSFGVCFSTYAVPMIIGEIRRFIRDDDPVSISRSLKENASLVKRRREDLSKKLGREPSIKELADSLSMEAEQVVSALEAVQPMLSINEAIYQDDGDAVYLLDKLKADDNGGEAIEELNLRRLLDTLPPRLQKIIYMRYFMDKTQVEVAEQLGISQVHVSRLEKHAFAVMRDLLKE